jgi:hypothetical protein
VPESPMPEEFLEKRRLLHGKGLDAKRAAAAGAFLGAGRIAEALEILERTRDAGALARARKDAVRAGDVFSLSRACQILRVEADAAEWRELAENARKGERWYDAVNALERSGDAAAAEALRAEKCPDFKPFKPSGK